MDKLRIGIIGCGEVVQILHMPSLHHLAEQFTVTALCDISRTVVDAVGDQWQIPPEKRFLNEQDLLAQDDVDAVLITTPNVYHKDTILAALAAGKHVMVEKPMCMTLEEADEIIAADANSDCIVQVGTMRRYAPAFIKACELVKQMDVIRLARVQDIIGSNKQFISPTSRVVRADDISAEQIAEVKTRTNVQITAAIGDKPDHLRSAYSIMLGLSTHDTSAMRELLGMPGAVLYATARNNGRCLTAAFDYGDYICHFETSINAIANFDANLQVYGHEQIVRVQYDTPYVRNLPIYLDVLSATDTSATQHTHEHEWGDPFVEEWSAFYDNVQQKRTPKSSAADFRQDLTLFGMMIQHM